MIRLAHYIRARVEFPPAPDGSEFLPEEQFIYGGQMPDDPLVLVQMIVNQGSSPPGRPTTMRVQFFSRSPTAGHSEDLINALHDARALGSIDVDDCLKHYRNKFMLPAVNQPETGLELPALEILEYRADQPPFEIGPDVGGGHIRTFNATLIAVL